FTCNSFNDNFTFPHVPNGSDFLFIQSSAEGLVHKVSELFKTQVFWNVRLQSGKIGLSVNKGFQCPFRPAADLKNVFKTHAGRHGQTISDVSWTKTEGRYIA